MDASEILARYAAGEREFCGVELDNANLSGANLRKADLSEANLSGANLTEANLIGANLSGANLSGADLSKAHLMGANLSEANLMGADLRGAKPTGADLSRADLRGADVRGADLRGADVRGADLRGADLIRADLIRANLSRAYLNGAYLSRANLSRSNLSGANLSGADLSRANLMGANLFETLLTDTILSEAKLDGTILAYQKISEELKQENQELRETLSLFETQFENRVEKEIQRRLITNQGIKAKKGLTWEGMRFRSNPEREIAKVFDEMGVMFFPLPSGRVMTEEGMTTREVDFLVCSRGKWGILECDGIWHILNSIQKGQMPSAALDHKRDNDFNRHGQWFIKRFTDEECKENPHKVVRQFLDMLHKFHEDQHYQITGDSPKTEPSPLQSNLSPQREYDENGDLMF